jgi:hypothetical protein
MLNIIHSINRKIFSGLVPIILISLFALPAIAKNDVKKPNDRISACIDSKGSLSEEEFKNCLNQAIDFSYLNQQEGCITSGDEVSRNCVLICGGINSICEVCTETHKECIKCPNKPTQCKSYKRTTKSCFMSLCK